ncbi:MAG: hypothetical protein AB2L18_08385 [Anaerolineaceae bacterium]
MNTKTISIFLGAGFSKWAANIPLSNELFDFIIKPFGKREQQQYEIVKCSKESWDASNPGGTAEQYIAYALKQPEKISKSVLWYITRRLSDSFIWTDYYRGRVFRHELMIDENRKYQYPGVVLAQKFLLSLNSYLAGIITSNYDFLVEYALGTKMFNYGKSGEILNGRGAYPVSQWRNPVMLKGTIPLAKIHGSISWDSTARYTDGRRGITGNALIVPPSMEKKVPESLIFEWDLAKNILNYSNTILIFGFAFNTYDEALLNLLKQSSKNISHVINVNIINQIDSITNIWHNAKYDFLLPPGEDNIEFTKWLSNINQISTSDSNNY